MIPPPPHQVEFQCKAVDLCVLLTRLWQKMKEKDLAARHSVLRVEDTQKCNSVCSNAWSCRLAADNSNINTGGYFYYMQSGREMSPDASCDVFVFIICVVHLFSHVLAHKQKIILIRDSQIKKSFNV